MFYFRINGVRLLQSISSKLPYMLSEKNLIIADNQIKKHELIKIEKHLHELKNAFLSNVSHEIRTPMNAIVGFSNLLKDDNFSMKQKQFFIEEINNNSKELLRLIDNIIIASDLNRFKDSTIRSEFQPYDILYKIFTDYSDRLQKQGGSQKIQMVVDPKNSHISINSNFKLFDQALRNLVDSSIRANYRGSIKIGYTPVSEGYCNFYVKTLFASKTNKILPNSDLNISSKQGYKQINKNETDLYVTLAQKCLINLNTSLKIQSSLRKGVSFSFTLPIIADKKRAEK